MFLYGRKKEEEEGSKNPHLASTGRKYPTCLKFGGSPVGVMRFSGDCLEGVRMVADQVGTVPVETLQVRTGQVRTGQFRTGQFMTRQVRTGEVRTGQVMAGQVGF